MEEGVLEAEPYRPKELTMGSQEALAVQFLANIVFSTANYVMSQYHAGLGQITLGSSHRQKVDFAASLPPSGTSSSSRGGKIDMSTRLVFVNYDGMAFHTGGAHLRDCRLNKDGGVSAETGKMEEGSSLAETYLCSNSNSSISSYEASDPPVDDDDDYDEDDGNYEAALRSSYAREMLNCSLGEDDDYDDEDNFEVVMNNDDVNCDVGRDAERTRRAEDELLQLEGLGKGGISSGDWMKHVTITRTGDTDELKRAYCAFMSEVEPDCLTLKYHTVHECQLMHDPSLLDVGELNPEFNFTYDSSEEVKSSLLEGKSIRSLLERFCREESVFEPGRKSYTQAELVSAIMNPDESNLDMGGFVVVRGGTEDDSGKDGVLPGIMGCCHQRRRLDDDSHLGDFTKFQMSNLMNWADRSRRQLNLVTGERTFTATGFHGEGETISVGYLRFLIKERGFSGFEISHLLFFREKKFLTPFIEEILQKRYDLRLVENSLLRRTIYKLFLNGGFISFFSFLYFFLSFFLEEPAH